MATTGPDGSTTPKSPHAYANAAMEYITAMKAVDPSIRVGVVLTTPGFWPDGEVGSEDSGDWNDVVLSTVGGRADFGIFHWYPYTDSTTEAEMLTRPPTAASVVEAFRADLDRHDATNTEIFVTELNGGKPRNTQAQALWAADAYLSLAAAGVHNATWWNVHNGSGGTATDVTGATDYNDEGLLSNGSGNEPAAQTPFRAYYGIQMLSRVAQAGDILVRASSSTTTVSAHAARRANGALSVLLVNKDPANSVTVTLSYTGYRRTARRRPGVEVEEVCGDDALGLGPLGSLGRSSRQRTCCGCRRHAGWPPIATARLWRSSTADHNGARPAGT